MKIAVFLPNWLGDVAMATPTLRALRRRFPPPARIVGVMRPYLADVPAGADWFDEQWYFDPRAEDRRLHGGSIARRMRGERFDLAVLMPNSLRTAWVAWRGGAGRRVGYVRYGRGPLLTDKLYPRRERGRIAPEPMVETYLQLASSLGCEDESRRLELFTTEADERSAEAVFRRLGIGGRRPVAALNSSGAYGGSKLWPVEHFGRLARRIVDELGYDVLVLCGPKEREIARQVVREAGAGKGDSHLLPERPFGCFAQKVAVTFSGSDQRMIRPSQKKTPDPFICSMADQPLDLGTAKGCIRRCRIMVSTDSGPRHVAAALGLPVVTMFGPMLPVWSENPTQRAANLALDLDCIGCHKRVCPLGHHRCMRELSVETVFRATCGLLGQT